MYGMIMANGAIGEKFAKEINSRRFLSGNVDVTRCDLEMAASERVVGTDFVVAECNGDGVTEKLIFKFAYGTTRIKRVYIGDVKSHFTVIYKDTCKEAFENGDCGDKKTVEEFLTSIEEGLRRNVTGRGLSRIREFMTKIGLYANLSGYTFITAAVSISVKYPEKLRRITREIYPEIAERYRTTARAVERNIRNAITVVCNRGKMQEIANKYYGGNFSPNEKPTNSEFIAYLTTIAEADI